MENQINNMRSVEMAFRDAYDHVMSNILGTKEKEEINLFLADVCAQLSIHMAFTTTGLPEMIQKVKMLTNHVVLVGGGIRTGEDARKAVQAGADIIVTGTVVENTSHIKEKIAGIVEGIKSI